jgi:predicted metalloprotease with PDZ domain
MNDEKKLTLGGTGTAKGLEDFVKEEAKNFDINLSTSPGGYGPSDHASFYVKDIPVLFFFTGTHDDYHKPSDDVDKINFEGMKSICDYVIAIVSDQASEKGDLVFTEAGSKEEPRRMRFRVTLGVVPDYGSDAKGLRLDGVRKGGPADKAGMQKGDVVVSMDGKPVNNIYDYMGRLAEFKAGQQIKVEVMRGEEKMALDVTF